MYSKEIENIIRWFEFDVNDLINNVLNDDKDDPEYSAVTCCNKIISLIRVKEGYAEKYKTIEHYLTDLGYSKEEIQDFIENRDKESKYYHGEILTL